MALSLVHFIDSYPSLLLFLAIFVCEKLVHLFWRVSHSLNFVNSIPRHSWVCSSVLCNSCNFVVGSRGLIRFGLEIFGKSHSISGCNCLLMVSGIVKISFDQKRKILIFMCGNNNEYMYGSLWFMKSFSTLSVFLFYPHTNFFEKKLYYSSCEDGHWAPRSAQGQMTKRK